MIIMACIIASFFTGSILGFMTAAMMAAAAKRDVLNQLALYMMTTPPYWVHENNLTMVWMELQQYEREQLVDRYISVRDDKENLDSFIQSIREYYSV